MQPLSPYLRQWQANPLREILAGAVATLALIPEVIAFSITAGIDPAVGLYGSFVIAVVMALFGGRPAMISAAAGSVALVAAPLIRAHGVEYLFAAGILAGIFQIAFGFGRLAWLLRYISLPIQHGFVNALAVLIFSAQVPHMLSAGLWGWALIALGLVLILALPRLSKAVPAPLLAVLILTLIAEWADLPVLRIGDLGSLPAGLPQFAWPEVALTVDLLRVIFLPAMAIAMVGLLESLLTARVADVLTESPSNKNIESAGLGLANISASLLGGIAGCGMIGQTVANIKYGGRGRLSVLVAGALLLVLMVLLKDQVARIPMAALVAIMILVSWDTLDRRSLLNLPKTGVLAAGVIAVTTIVTILSHNLALGVLGGLMLSLIGGRIARWPLFQPFIRRKGGRDA